MRDGEDGFTDAGVSMRPAPPRDSWLRRWRWPLMIGGPLLLLAVVAFVVITGGRSQSTDNAYVQAEKVPVSASIGGRVVSVNVRENQRVKTGQELFSLDSRDLAASLDQTEAQLAAARTQAMSLRAAYLQEQAAVQAARESVAFTAREAQRQHALVVAGVSSRQQESEAVHANEQAQRQLTVAQGQAAVALANMGGDADLPLDRQPAVMEAAARVQKARLSASYTVVRAPKDGIVTRVQQLQVGGYINPAQTVFWLISGVPWVEANFKEDQLGKMQVGQPAALKIDAYPDVVFAGHVASFSPGTGAAFSALPAQNATGNWVKVVQRLPVQIAFDKPPPDMAARVGLSANVKVDVRPAAARAR
ncbi:HlyD family secretion protein [Phenylobacterium sp.]|uniref:HlyD family secretion protein n=1 Tax=Phenylobacterium sp. TaxID=1871053 RepID=UPI002F40C78F